MHLDLENVSLDIHDKKHVGIEIKSYNLDTFKKQVDINCIDLESEFVDLNYKVASLIFCHFWRSIGEARYKEALRNFFIDFEQALDSTEWNYIKGA